MSGVARIHKEQIEVALLRQQLGRLDADLLPPATPLLLQNPVLLLQLLAQTPASDSLPALLQNPPADPATLQRLLRQSALQLLLTDTIPDQAFLARHWLRARHTALLATALARQCGYATPSLAEATGLMLQLGMLVLLQRHGTDYAALVSAHPTRAALLEAEQARWQQDHVELGVALLEKLGFDQFCVDALRYQVQPLPQLLDASLLVKLCWLAAQLADAAPPATLVQAAGELLPTLQPAVLDGIRAQVVQTLTVECEHLGLPMTDGHTLPAAALAHSSRQQLQLLRQQLLALDPLFRHDDSAVQTPAGLQQRLAALLQDAGLGPLFIVLQSATAAADTLQAVASQGLGADPASVELVCRPQRSVLADLVLRGDIDTLSATSTGMTVVDRQLLRLLGGGTVVCEPVQAGGRRAVLLLGLNTDDTARYTGHATLRRLLRSTLLALLRQPGGESSDLLLYRQRVREAVHEANNPLTIIKNYLHLLGLKQGADMAGEMALLRQEIDRVAGILQALREPAAGTAPAPLDLNALVSGMHRLFEGAYGHAQEAGKQIRVELQLAPDPVRVLAAADTLKQILTNLVKNAVEAIEGSGIIVISTRPNVWQQGRLYGQLTVADNGPGIAPALLQQLFSPGLTTRSGSWKGSGLAIVKGLVENLQGQISCQSDRNGTALTLLLPQVS